MAALHKYGTDGVAEAFSPCLQPAICSGCAFQRACPEGRLFLNA
jgi:hypothetical protein